MTNAPDSTKAVVIERVFDAPIDLVWAMWTHADHFKAWYGPDGASETIWYHVAGGVAQSSPMVVDGSPTAL